jgi:transposase
MSRQSVHRIWKENDLKPHLRRTFKISNDPQFEQKFWDVIGLYLNPPDKALVLCCDEKSQCQALERTQPGLPLGIGHIRTQTHDYIRHGTITLFAALNYLDGKILSRTETRHTHVEWLRFLKQLDRETPAELQLHLIVDNYATHKHEKVRNWLKRHPRIVLHFTPTASSWMNLVERFFADLTQDCVREGSFASVRELIHAIDEFLAVRNEEPKRYVWRAKGEEILRKIEKAKIALNRVINS